MATRFLSAFPLVLAAGFGVSGCFPPDDGRSPPLGELYFPVGLAVNPDRSRLYVANSDFDLKYNAGSLQVMDLTRLRGTDDSPGVLPRYCESDADCVNGRVCDSPAARLTSASPSHWCVDPAKPDACGALGEKSPAERLLAPGRCGPVDIESVSGLLADRVEIGAFVTDVVYSPRPEAAGEGAPGRLFLPVRGDATLHWVDVEPDGRELDCGQGSDQHCDANHRRGDAPSEENNRGTRLPTEPFGVAVDERGEAVLTTHQTEGSVGLFVNDWTGGAAGGPRLQFVRGGLPSGALGVASIPIPLAVVEDPTVRYQPGFLVTFTTSPEVRLVQYFNDALDPRFSPVDGGLGGRALVEVSRAAFISTNSEGYNSRGIAVDASRRAACEARCEPSAGDARKACLRGCVGAGFDVFVANRSPASLIFGASQPAPGAVPPDDVPSFSRTVPVPLGASRVIVGNVRDPSGHKVSRVFVICFDSKEIFVYDPVSQLLDKVIHTGRGPHALAVDDGVSDVGDDAYGYIGHFTDSYIGVVDLNQAHATYGEIILTLGKPSPPRASK